MKEDHRDKKAFKNSGSYGIRKLYLCDNSAALDMIFIIYS